MVGGLFFYALTHSNRIFNSIHLLPLLNKIINYYKVSGRIFASVERGKLLKEHILKHMIEICHIKLPKGKKNKSALCRAGEMAQLIKCLQESMRIYVPSPRIHPHQKARDGGWCILTIPSLQKGRQADHGGSWIGQPGLLGKLQACERPCLKKQEGR